MSRSPEKQPSRRALALERAAWLAGLVLLAATAAGYGHRALNSQADTEAFAAARAVVQSARAAEAGHRSAAEPQAKVPAEDAHRLAEMETAAAPDFSLWSPTRVEDYRSALEADERLPLAMLRIPEVGVEVAVLTGTDELTLNRGVGHIEGTPLPGARGNVGLAGHRDGFFRPLKDIESGDHIELVTLEDSLSYRVTDTWIVDPSEVSVLAPTDEDALTLVTCYPFYFVGHAPQRFIVRAVRQPAAGAAGMTATSAE